MMTHNQYLSLVECNIHIELINLVFDRGRRLPEIVFSRKMKNFCFFEFNSMITPEFMSTLRKITEHFRDDRVFVTVLDPDPVEYFFREFGHCGAFQMSSKSTNDEYFDVLAHEPPESPADALLYNSNIITWTASGNKWAMWGERDTGIGVLGAEDDLKFLSSVKDRIPNLLAADIATYNLHLDETETANYKASMLQNFG
jgi:hypothetical protein